MRVAAIQHDVVWEDPLANHEHLLPLISRAAAEGADLIVLSEMYATGFSMAAQKIAEEVHGQNHSFLREQAEKNNVWIAGSVATRDLEKELPVNRFLVVSPSGESNFYDKLYPFTFAGEHEKYSPGDKTVTVDLFGFRTSLFICYDLRFANTFWELAPTTDLYLVVANWPATRSNHWKTLLRARAIENQAYVIGVNRVGEGDGLSYQGDTVILDPLGEVIKEASLGAEEIVIADIDIAKVSEVRANFPFINDRRNS